MSKKGKATQVPIFISKIYQMIESKNNSEAIDWTSSNDSFSIKNISKFTDQVLPVYFKHRNFASFIRQLNMYGFKKIRHSDGQNVYMNQNFKAGAKNLLKFINRKNKEQKEEQIQLYRGANSERIQAPIGKQIQQLKINQKNLQEMCKYFINQNQRIMQENQKFVKRLDCQQKAKEEKLQQILIYLLTQKNTNALLNSAANQPQLSIANQQYQGEKSPLCFSNGETNNLSPLQQIDKAIRQKQQISNVRDMIREIYGNAERNKDTGYSIQNHEVINKKDANFDDYVEHQLYQNKRQAAQNQHQLKEGQKGDCDFLSINDFWNADEQQNPPSSVFEP